MATRLSITQLNNFFADDLGDNYAVRSSMSEKPLLLSPKKNPDVVYKVYTYNCTNPPGGRTLDEYKIQLILPNQKRGTRGFLDDTDGSIILIVGFAVYDTLENGVLIIWETSRHREFAYSANLQVKMGSLLDTITKKVFCLRKPGNGEYIILADRNHLQEAVTMRQKVDIDNLLEE